MLPSSREQDEAGDSSLHTFCWQPFRRPSSSVPHCCLRSSRCSPRWCCTAGGAAAVWSVAMVFFQATLLAGYAYAHLLTRFAPGRGSVLIHLAVLLIACLALPLHLAGGWGQPPSRGRGVLAPRLICRLDRAAVLCSRRQWAAHAGVVCAHRSSFSTRPVFPFAASNVGSFLALISYPTIEPFLRLSEQTWLWTVGFYVLILLIAACGTLLLGSANYRRWPLQLAARKPRRPARDRLAFLDSRRYPRASARGPPSSPPTQRLSRCSGSCRSRCTY